MVEKTATWGDACHEERAAGERLAPSSLIPMLVRLVFSWQLPSLNEHSKQP